ncbi:MAG: ATP phosphoribosyltransferase [Phycisphaerae bacterium SM23_30]|nr:MAG: ATP phosphoribosyltransferase [Phycisphaerae bacterium SM23_30]
MEQALKIGLPKGSLQESTFDLFRRAGFQIQLSARSYFPLLDDPELEAVLFRAQELSQYVEDGVVDAGITGEDWIRENKSDVLEVCELIYSKSTSQPARWVLAVPNESAVAKVEDLEGGIIATELVNVTKEYFARKKVKVKVEFSWGATEVKARLLDGIVEITETGSSLRANNLRIIDTVTTSTTRLVANRAAWGDAFKREKIEGLALLLQGALEGREKVGLKMNLPLSKLDGVLRLLPAEKSPTVNYLADKEYAALEVVLPERAARDLVPRLKKAGASGIFTYPLNTVIP